MKKWMAILLIMAMLLSFTACRSEETGNPTKPTKPADNVESPAEGYDGSEVTIVLGHGLPRNMQNVLDGCVEKFNALYPNITVHLENYGDHDGCFDTMEVMLSVGDMQGLPNVVLALPDHTAFYRKSNALVALDDLINSQASAARTDGSTESMGLTTAQIHDFIPGFYAGGKSVTDGLMYSLPFSKTCEVLYYNKTFFEENQIPVPTTWNEMEAVCRQIKELDPDSFPLGYYSENNLFINHCYQSGTDYITADGEIALDNEQNQAYVQQLRKWHQDGLLLMQLVADDIFDYTIMPHDHFTQDWDPTCYMVIDIVSAAYIYDPDRVQPGDSDFEVGIAMLPQEDTANPKVICNGLELCMFKKDNRQEMFASWLFMKFLATNAEFQAELAVASNYCPVIQSAIELPVYQDYLASAENENNIEALAAKAYTMCSDAFYVPAGTYKKTAPDVIQKLIIQCAADTFSGSEEEAIRDLFRRAAAKIGSGE